MDNSYISTKYAVQVVQNLMNLVKYLSTNNDDKSLVQYPEWEDAQEFLNEAELGKEATDGK